MIPFPKMTIRRSLADMTLDLPGTFFFQIVGRAPGIVLLASPFYFPLEAIGREINLEPLGLKQPRSQVLSRSVGTGRREPWERGWG